MNKKINVLLTILSVLISITIALACISVFFILLSKAILGLFIIPAIIATLEAHAVIIMPFV